MAFPKTSVSGHPQRQAQLYGRRETRRLPTTLAVLLAMSFGLSAPMAAQESIAPDRGARNAERLAGGTVQLRWNGASFTLTASNASLRDIVSALNEATGRDVSAKGEGVDEKTVNGDFAGSYEAILGRILAGYNHALVYENSGGTERLTEVTVIGSGPGDNSSTPEEADPAPPPGTAEMAGNAAPDMIADRQEFAAHELSSGDRLVIGGRVSGAMARATDRIDRRDAATGQWSTIAYMSQKRAALGLCPLDDGRILLIGGRNGPDDDDPARVRSAELFDPADLSIRLLRARTTYPHFGNVTTLPLADGRCAITSGSSRFRLEIFDSRDETFAAVPMPDMEDGDPPAAAILDLLPDGDILYVGAQSLVIDPDTGQWRKVP